MDLILWRHADAEPGEPDLDRPLTAKGVRQAERMAAWLDGHLPDGCRILVSRRTRPADRTRSGESSRPCPNSPPVPRPLRCWRLPDGQTRARPG